MILRDYQKKALNYFQDKEKENKLFVIATGKGKSLLSLSLILKHLESKDNKIILVICPTQLIRNQLYKLYSTKLNVFVIEGSNHEIRDINASSTNLYLCCYRTYEILYDKEPYFIMNTSLLIIDEVHKVNTGTTLGKKIMNISATNNMIKVGFTATPGTKKNLSQIKEVLSCKEENVYYDVEPLHQKIERVFFLEAASWRLNLIDSLKSDLILLSKKYNVSAEIADFSFNYSLVQGHRFLQGAYLLLNKMTRLVHGATPSRILHFYDNNIRKSICHRYFSSSTRTMLYNLENMIDERFGYLTKMEEKKRIIFVDDILIGEELKKLVSNSYFINSKEKNEIRGIFKKLKTESFFNLIATSIAEEGLNLDLDEVINFEVPTTTIKREQRKGRVGRYRRGFVVYFNVKGTFGSLLLNKYKIKNLEEDSINLL